jgi:hypothetical protein
VSDDEQDEASNSSRKIACTLRATTISYVEQLVDVGTHGATFAGVMTRLIEEGVREALRDGLIERPPVASSLSTGG